MAMTQRCGLVAVLGAPNAGKSTLVTALVGQKVAIVSPKAPPSRARWVGLALGGGARGRQRVAIVSPKAQTTRARLMGIAIEGEAQVLLVDTPGIFAPRRRLDRAMVKAAWEGAESADRVLLGGDAAATGGGRGEAGRQGGGGR